MKKYWTAVLLFFFFNTNITAQTLPSGFNQVLVASSINKPTAMAFAPGNRIFVCSQTGDCSVIQNDTLLATPFVSLSVNSSGERGLIGIAVDPNFSVNNYIYLYYTLPNASNNRISRFTANGNVAVAGSETVILELDSLSSATNHNGGCMKFGLDGTLYVGVGENAVPANSQNLDSYMGKVLRINSNGTVPSGNPYTSGSAQRQRIWSYGVRNPFTIDIQPVTGKLFINDVGNATWEEVDDGTTSNLNFGWPNAEGNSTNPAYANPVYTYAHGTGTFLGCAITGGCFFNPSTTNYPASYVGKYFFMDYCGKWINYFSPTGTPNVTNFATVLPDFPLSLSTGPDGNLYYLSYQGNGGSSLYRIVYTANASPIIIQQPLPATVIVGQPLSFSVVVSGTTPFTYQWRKNGSAISGATNSSYTKTVSALADSGLYSVVVTNASGTTTSSDAKLTVTPFNNLPVATISNPANGSSYTAGQTISFSASATDVEDGTLPASAFAWEVVFHHNSHIHPGPTVPQGVTSGSFVIPTIGEVATTVFYRLYCYVTDSQGGKDTTYVDLIPLLSNITISTNPAGLQVSIEGQPQNSPYTTSSVEGMQRTIAGVSPQTISGITYTFNNWSDGGANPKNIITPVNDITYTANFTCSISSPASISSNATNNTICSSNNVTLTENGGVLPIGGAYKWYSGGCGSASLVGSGTSITVAPTITTAYYVRAEGGCGNSTCRSITITVIPFNASVTPSGTVYVCAGGNTTLTANSGTGISYQWYRNNVSVSGATGVSYIANSPGTYTVKETGSCGTVTSNSVIVSYINNPTPAITYTTPLSFCTPGYVLLSANTFTGVAYQWQKNSVDIVGATSETYSATSNGTYRVKETANGCTKTAPSVATTIAASVTSAITANGPTTFCTGGSVILSVTNAIPGYSYQWENNGTNISGATLSSYTATSTGSYTCFVSASCGNATSAAIATTVGGITATITPSGTSTICAGSALTFSANTGTGFTYQWYRNGAAISGAINSTYSASSNGTYKVIVSQSGSCSSTSANAILVVTNNPTPTITAGGPTTFCAGQSVTLTANTFAGVIYEWQKNSVAISGATAQAYVATTAGTYRVKETANGCTKYAVAVSVVVNCRVAGDWGQGTGAGESVNEIKIIPNPSNGKLKLETGNLDGGEIKIKVLDVLGKEVFSTQFKNAEEINVHEMDLSKLINGIYFLQVTTSTEQKTLKVVKQ
jgi:glucose/arabinose dehydrogenase